MGAKSSQGKEKRTQELWILILNDDRGVIVTHFRGDTGSDLSNISYHTT